MNSISSYISGDHGLFIVGIVVTTLGTLCLSYGYLNNAAIKLFIRSISYGLVFAAIGLLGLGIGLFLSRFIDFVMYGRYENGYIYYFHEFLSSLGQDIPKGFILVVVIGLLLALVNSQLLFSNPIIQKFPKAVVFLLIMLIPLLIFWLLPDGIDFLVGGFVTGLLLKPVPFFKGRGSVWLILGTGLMFLLLETLFRFLIPVNHFYDIIIDPEFYDVRFEDYLYALQVTILTTSLLFLENFPLGLILGVFLSHSEKFDASKKKFGWKRFIIWLLIGSAFELLTPLVFYALVRRSPELLGYSSILLIYLLITWLGIGFLIGSCVLIGNKLIRQRKLRFIYLTRLKRLKPTPNWPRCINAFVITLICLGLCILFRYYLGDWINFLFSNLHVNNGKIAYWPCSFLGEQNGQSVIIPCDPLQTYFLGTFMNDMSQNFLEDVLVEGFFFSFIVASIYGFGSILSYKLDSLSKDDWGRIGTVLALTGIIISSLPTLLGI